VFVSRWWWEGQEKQERKKTRKIVVFFLERKNNLIDGANFLDLHRTGGTGKGDALDLAKRSSYRPNIPYS
jgi:hypothetical protein